MRLLTLIIYLTFQSLSYAKATVLVSGILLDEHKHPISNASVVINEREIFTDISGRYQTTLSVKSTYQFTFNKKGYYPSIHSFDHAELSQLKHTIPVINLVKKQPKRVMLAFGGDVMMGRRYYKPYFGDDVLISSDTKLTDSKAIVKHIKPYMSIADYAAVNLETQIATETPPERAPKSVTFFSQPETLTALSWAGVDYVTLGNNHTYDYVESGLKTTLSALKKSELDYSGAGYDEQHALKAHRENINGTSLSMLGFVGWEGSSMPKQTASNLQGGAAYGSMENIITTVKQELDAQQLPIIQYHGSQEYANEPTGVTEQRLKAAINNGAALAIAHHPHVAQGLELYNNKLIAYSMGNFIFDQYFTATQHSFVLYVWLDEGKFHRAEIVPIYVKGYKPTPATGMQRNTVMRRLKYLSKLRNTPITPSGGHGVITTALSNSLKTYQTALEIPNKTTTQTLYQLPWHSEILKVTLPDSSYQYRLGTNLINNSDFENFSTFDSPERGFTFSRSSTLLNGFGAQSQHSLGLSITPNQNQIFGMQSFRRVYRASNPMTVTAKIKTEKSIKINFYWQGRRTRQKLFDARKNSPKNLIGTIELDASNNWQPIELGFNSPRIGYRSYRVLAELENNHSETLNVNIDDFAVIEWQSTFSSNARLIKHNQANEKATFIGLNKPTPTSISIEYQAH